MPHFLLGKMEKEDLFNISAGRLKLHKAQEVLRECGSVWCFQTTNIILKIFPVVVNYTRPRPPKESSFNWLAVRRFIQTLLNKIKGKDVMTPLWKGRKKIQSCVNKLSHLLDVSGIDLQPEFRVRDYVL